MYSLKYRKNVAFDYHYHNTKKIEEKKILIACGCLELAKNTFMMIDLSLEEAICLKICEIPIFDFPQQAFKFCPRLARNMPYIHYHNV